MCTQGLELLLGAGQDHTQTSLFLQHKGGDRVPGKGKSCLLFTPGEASCSHKAPTAAAAALSDGFSALLLPLGGGICYCPQGELSITEIPGISG